MAASDAKKIAYWLVKNNYDAPRNTKDGNMKLQKLLYFAQLIHLAKFDTPLFSDRMCAFEQGTVIENIRVSYYYDFQDFLKECYESKSVLQPEVFETLKLVKDIFGDLSATELSDLNHEHKSWQESFENSKVDGTLQKNLSTITVEQIVDNELSTIKDMILAYDELQQEQTFVTINSKKFYYDSTEVEVNDDLKRTLESFDGDDSAYSIYHDKTMGLVIY